MLNRLAAAILITCHSICSPVNAQTHNKPIMVAVLDYDAISRKFSESNLKILNLSDEAQQKIRKLNEQKTRLLTEILAAKDSATLEKLEEEKDIITRKIWMAREIAGNRNGYAENFLTIQRFVMDSYGKEFHIIIHRELTQGANYQFSANENCKLVDITERVTADLQKRIP